MQLRKMVAADYGAVFELWTNCPEMELNDVDDSREGVERFLTRNPDTCFVAEEDNVILGVLLAGCDGRRGYIYHAAVKPERRGRGIGSAMVEAALSALKAMGVSKVGLLTFCDNEGGNRFWKEHGFDARTDLLYHSNVLADVHRIGIIRE